MNNIEQRVENMWSSVPPTVFETAPSSTGLYESEEITLVANALAKRVRPENPNLLVLGSATGYRETMAVHASGLRRFSSVTAVDLAPQLLELAERRMRRFQRRGFIDRQRTILASIHNIPSPDEFSNAVVIAGLYDFDCLANKALESNGEAVGLEEYGNGMSAILGDYTKLIPLRFEQGTFVEEPPLASYHSGSSEFNNGYHDIRNIINNYASNRSDLAGMRIHISHNGNFSAEDGKPLFVSTWFVIPKVQEIFEQIGLAVNVERAKSLKGAVLTISRPDILQTENVALVMNNVTGNLATAEMLTSFTKGLEGICR